MPYFGDIIGYLRTYLAMFLGAILVLVEDFMFGIYVNMFRIVLVLDLYQLSYL